MQDDDSGKPDTAAFEEHMDRLVFCGMDVEEYLLHDEEASIVRRLRAMDTEARRGFKAFMLAPTLPLYLALMAGEKVPWWMLTAEQARRFKLKPGHEGYERVGVDDFNDVRS
jgi:hypothetical protein